MKNLESHLHSQENFNKERISSLLEEFRDHKKENRADNDKMYALISEVLKEVKETKEQALKTNGRVNFHDKEMETLKEFYKTGVTDYREEFTCVRTDIDTLKKETEVVRFFGKNKKIATATVIGTIVIFITGIWGTIEKIGDYIRPEKSKVKTEIVKK
jgi:uncharacterized coiled-coil DUF342 family protein